MSPAWYYRTWGWS